MIEVKVLDRDGIRIDKYLNEEFDISRSRIKKLIDDEKILVNGKSIKASYLVKMDDVILVNNVIDKESDIPMMQYCNTKIYIVE